MNGTWNEIGRSATSYYEDEWARYYESLGTSEDKRTPFEKDRDRIIHCAAFRRLQGKTQVFGMGSSDFFRTRLTHSLEAAQIGKGIAIHSNQANADLVEASCLAHDIGHPPFGHTGEHVLKELMKDAGGFEANAQNLRILSKLEVRTAKKQDPGLNISRATIDALLKYKKPYSSIDKTSPIDNWKFYYDNDSELVKWATLNAPSDGDLSFECQVMNWADEIAYSTHDLEDGIKVGMITESKISTNIETNVKSKIDETKWKQSIWDDIISKINQATSHEESATKRKGIRRDLIANLIHNFIIASKATKREGGPYHSRYQYTLQIEPDIETKCKMLKSLVWELIINDEHVATLQRKASIIVERLFKEFTKFDDKDRTREMYPGDYRQRLDQASTDDEKLRIACDYISGMTDNYASRLYSRLIEGETTSLLDMIS